MTILIKNDIGKAIFSYGHLESENCLGKFCALRHGVSTLFAVFLFSRYICGYGDRGGTVVKVLCYNRMVAGSITDGVIGIFH